MTVESASTPLKRSFPSQQIVSPAEKLPQFSDRVQCDPVTLLSTDK